MLDLLVAPLLWFAAIACGLIGGLSLAFATLIPRALDSLDRRAAAAVIFALSENLARSVFAVLFWGASVSSVTLIILIAPEWGDQFRSESPMPWGAHSVVMGGLAFAFGVFVTTVLSSGTMISIFARLREGDLEEYGPVMLIQWKFWNLMRALGATIAMACFIIALATR